MNVRDATTRYEQWLGERLSLVSEDLALKHRQMAVDEFAFMRATFYRWAELFPLVCPAPAAAPRVLAVGDLHVENFGTWRDAEGRLAWGVNDFDEAVSLPYTNDLVRLAVSARLAIDAGHLAIRFRVACEAILQGYSEGLQSGGKPFVLAEEHPWLRSLAQSDLRDPAPFWAKLRALPAVEADIGAEARRALEESLPDAGLTYRVVHRAAGLGSLGRPRWTAITDWRGAKIAREVKPLVPSAAAWAAVDLQGGLIAYEQIETQSVRVPDPFLQQRGSWIVRRLAPDCARVELAMLKEAKDDVRLLHSMGRETANVHLGSREAVGAVLADVKARPAGWLRDDARLMVSATNSDWTAWRKAHPAG